MFAESLLTYQRSPLDKGVIYSFHRSLDKSSEISIKVNDPVRPETVVASGWRKSGYRMFNLAKLFGLDPKKVSGILQRTIGSRIYKGDVIATYKEWMGLKEKVFRSPLNGVLLDYNPVTTRLTIQYLPTEVKTVAGVSGKVVRILPGESVEIATRVNLIKGLVAFGVDREGSVLEVGYPDIPLQSDQILPKYKGKVIFGGTSISIDALYKALSVGVQLIITGGINFEDYMRLHGTKGRYEDVGISVLATEGFGASRIYPPIYDLLKESENRHIFFEANQKSAVVPLSQDAFSAEEISIDSQSFVTKETAAYGLLQQGSKVRILSSLNYGAYGIVSKVIEEPCELEVTLPKKTVTVKPYELEIIDDETA